MPTPTRRPDFFTSQAGLSALQLLQTMMADDMYNTVSSYSANAILYPDHRISFCDKHMAYLRDHPGVDPDLYISNLRLMTKIQ
jgi:hypothetical protein